jgi:hypothetical protein
MSPFLDNTLLFITSRTHLHILLMHPSSYVLEYTTSPYRVFTQLIIYVSLSCTVHTTISYSFIHYIFYIISVCALFKLLVYEQSPTIACSELESSLFYKHVLYVDRDCLHVSVLHYLHAVLLCVFKQAT